MPTRIDTVSARSRLKPRREPHWHKITKGCYLGYRKMAASGGGTWCARSLDSLAAKQAYKALGGFEEVPDHERFDAAQRAAREWFDHLGRGGSAGKTTVRKVCENYVEHLRVTKSDKAAADAEARFVSYVYSDAKLVASEVSKLVPAQIEAWRKSLRDRPTRSGGNRGGERSASTLNRDITCFRAALNRAYADGLVTTDFAWRVKLAPIKNADRRRDIYLDRLQRRSLIEHAAPDLAQFLSGLAILPLRPGALAALTAGNYDRRLSVISVGKDKQGQDRRIKLPPKTAALFAEAAKDKLPKAPLFSRSNGKPWNKDAWKKPVHEAVSAAGLPSKVTAYTLRHSVISDLVHDGLDLLTVAQISGTSVVMIERHYGHLRADVAAAALAKLSL